ncbi:hypothetical protein IQ06DRAFT_366769 [Phaeosphaeriaceae sp. SRC1lsM3a]|nr:hypothetical protein IQ06DRAFT_366769 [Stagonospora sp. SRC1lsM3a]
MGTDSWCCTNLLGEPSDTISLKDSHIFLSDFSESLQPAMDVPQPSHTPYLLRSPESLLKPISKPSFQSEIWSLACEIFAIMGHRPLFEAWFPSKDRILEEHVDALGQLPEGWWERWVNCDQYFDDHLQRIDGTPRRSLEGRTEDSIQKPRNEHNMAPIDVREKQAFLMLLRSILSFRPAERPSAQEVLESSCMLKWAMSGSIDAAVMSRA